MTSQEKEKLFIEAYSFDRLTYDEFSNKYGIEREEVPILYDRTRKTTLKIQKIKNRYNSILNREVNHEFENFREFYTWFINQKDECYYCQTTQKDLKKLFEQNVLISKKFNATLHIERFDSSKPYSKNNCTLACAICNNAKSDFISKEDFQEFFAPAIQSYLNQKVGELR